MERLANLVVGIFRDGKIVRFVKLIRIRLLKNRPKRYSRLAAQPVGFVGTCSNTEEDSGQVVIDCDHIARHFGGKEPVRRARLPIQQGLLKYLRRISRPVPRWRILQEFKVHKHSRSPP